MPVPPRRARLPRHLPRLLVVTLAVALALGTAVMGSSTASAQDDTQYRSHGAEIADDWLGAYTWDDKQVWCVDFGKDEPKPEDDYQEDAFPEGAKHQAEISYLLLRYGTTTDTDEAVALSHLLHVYTAGVFSDEPYEAQAHLDAMSEPQRSLVEALTAEAAANVGPWSVELTAPEQAQVIGEQAQWSLQVTGDGGEPVGGVPVALNAKQAAVSSKLTTPEDGSPLQIPVTANGTSPSLTATVTAPAATPKLLVPTDDEGNPITGTQKIVLSGGETELTKTGTGTAETPPGTVHVNKLDQSDGSGVADVSLRVTGQDRKSPANDQDGAELTGENGKPLVVTTDAKGTATIDELATPQQICVIETAPATGYEDAFDEANPPTACGTVKPGGELTLTLKNVKNAEKPSEEIVVPQEIPAGGQPQATGSAETSSAFDPRLMGGLAGLALLLGGGTALAIRRLDRGQRR